jgi:S-adenosylmethionine-diacylglycerol 3-amino-3-carboxypropyl transferase
MVERLLEEKSLPERVDFYDRQWNNLRWRVLFRIFFSRRVMGKMGRDPEFFKYVDEDVAGGILKRTEYAFTVLPTHNNPYLNYIFRGNFNEDALPHYLRKEHFNTIKKNVGKITLVRGDLGACVKKFSGKAFDAFNLSDIFEYMSMTEFASELDRISSMSRRGARIAFWNMLADRRILSNESFDVDEALSESLFLKDTAFFYKRFVLAVKRGAGRKK